MNLSDVNLSDSLLAGVRGVWPVAVLVLPVGLAFGAAAVAQGMMPAEATLLNTFAFTALAQFAAQEFFEGQVHLFPMLIVFFPVGSRHLTMGVTLYPSLKTFSRWRQCRKLIFLSDPNYADMMRELRHDSTSHLSRLTEGGILLWLAWVSGTFASSVAGSSFSDLSQFGGQQCGWRDAIAIGVIATALLLFLNDASHRFRRRT